LVRVAGITVAKSKAEACRISTMTDLPELGRLVQRLAQETLEN